MKTKKVCHVTSAHARYDSRIYPKECVSLANAGYEVYLIVNDEKKDEKIKNVNIVSTGLLPRSRGERFLLSHKLLYNKALEVNAEVYHFHDPDLLELALRLKRNKGVKIIFDSHEDVPAQILDKEWIPKILRKPLSVLFGMYMRNRFHKFDYIIGVTPTQIEGLKKVNKKVEMITNYPLLKTGAKDVGERNDRTICFAGGISKQWNHLVVLDAITTIDVKYILCGPESEYLEEMKAHPAWEKVNYLGEVPFEQVEDILNKSSCAMALCEYNANTAGKYGTLGNTKLFEAMQAGTPVVCTDFVLWKEIIDKYNCGICVNPYDAQAVQAAIEFVLEHADEATQMGTNGICAVEEEFNWNVEERKLLNVYNSLE